jgi:hypothetical protein
MTDIETLLSQLSASEKLAAIDFLWNELEMNLDEMPSPDWHGDVIRDRLANPSPEPPQPLDVAMARVKEQVRARKASNGSGT